MAKTRSKSRLSALAVLALLSGCVQPTTTSQSAVTLAAAMPSAVVSEQSQSLTPAEMRQVTSTAADTAYTLGPNDVIAISIYMHPELSVPPPNSAAGGALITGDGWVSLPLIGSVQLGGMTLDQAQDTLTADYAGYLKNPRVTLQLMQAQSLSYYLLGAFTAPGIKYPGHQLTLLEALALGGTVDIPHADLYQSYVAHGAVKLPVDLYALLIDGDLTQNITLQAGDSIVVPSAETESAYVFGAVGKPGATAFQSGGLSLLQALSEAGLDLPNYTDARLSAVHIIRSHGGNAAFYIVNATKILNGQAATFALEPGDIVFVPPTPVATWNQVLAQIIPTLQTASYGLSPFVDIRYLETH
jgi:polysaccharide export outer membrane protein